MFENSGQEGGGFSFVGAMGGQIGSALTQLLMSDDIVPGTPPGSEFYAYVMFRAGRPCYVGKGKGDRYQDMQRYHNPHLRRIIKAAGGRIRSIKIRDGLTEQQALDFERLTIAVLGRERHGGILTNLNAGGDGQTGWVPSAETRANISKANKGRKHSEETRAKMSAAGKGRPKNAEWRKKIGRPGRKMSTESIAKMRASAELRWTRPEEKENLVRYHAEMSEEQKTKRADTIAAAVREAMKDPEKQQRQKDGAKIASSKRERTPEGRFA